MKYSIKNTVTILSVFVWFMGSITVRAEPIIDKLSGRIEAVWGGGIKRIMLPTGDAEDVLLRDPYSVWTFDLSPDGEQRILAAVDLLSQRDLLVLHFDKQGFRTIVNADLADYFRSPSFSPDGNKIAYLFRNEGNRLYMFPGWQLYTVNSDGTSIGRVTDLGLDWIKPSWFPQGKRLAIATREFRIYVIDTENGVKTKIVDFGTAPVVSHSGKRIAYFTKAVNEIQKKEIIEYRNIPFEDFAKRGMNEQGEISKEVLEMEANLARWAIHVYDMETKISRKVTDEQDLVQYINSPMVWSPDDRYLLYSRFQGIPAEQVTYLLDIESGQSVALTFVEGTAMVWRK